MSDPAGQVDFAGETFEVADRIGLMPMMRFAALAKQGLDANDMDALAATYDLIRQCIAPDDWARFERAADASRADGDDLVQVIKQVFEVKASRPTTQPSDSSDGPTTTDPRSTDGSSSRVVQRLEAQGRPDLAQVVVMTERARAS